MDLNRRSTNDDWNVLYILCRQQHSSDALVDIVILLIKNGIDVKEIQLECYSLTSFYPAILSRKIYLSRPIRLTCFKDSPSLGLLQLYQLLYWWYFDSTICRIKFETLWCSTCISSYRRSRTAHNKTRHVVTLIRKLYSVILLWWLRSNSLQVARNQCFSLS